MLSFGKILVLAALVCAVLVAFRRFGGGRGGAAGGASPTPPAPAPQTLERCPDCGVYYLSGAAEPCARAECPRRRES
jgi:hypothetical protein